MEDMNRGIIGFNCSGLSNILLKQKWHSKYCIEKLAFYYIVDCKSLSAFKIEIHFLQNGILKHPKIQNKKINPAMHFVWLKMTLLGWTLKLQKRSILFMHHES